jgi:diguanylate cyclase (GGDEF)-like protein/PAS domain S-box-containing protein
MKLRSKVLVTLLATFVVILAAFLLAAPTVLMRGYLAIEREQTQHNLMRVSDALALEARGVSRGDWAAWDDAYRFVRDHDRKFVEANLNVTSYQDLNVDDIGFFDEKGKAVWARSYDRHSDTLVPLRRELVERLRPGSRLLTHETARSHRYGLLMLESGPVLVSTRPISTSRYKGPIRGTIVMARSLTSVEVARLASLVHLIVRIEPVTRVRDASQKDLRWLESHAGTMLVRPLSGEVVTGMVALRDVYGEPTAILTVEIPRSVYWQGQKSVSAMVLLLLAVAVMFGLVIVTLLERLVLSPLGNLDAQVGRVSSSQDLSVRVSALGSDEIGGLGNEINAMLASIEEGDQALRESEAQARHAMELHELAARRFQELFDGIPAACFAYDSEGVIYEWNRACESTWNLPAHLVLFRSMFETIIPDDRRAEVKDRIQRVFAGEHINGIEWRHNSTDGKESWLLMSTFPLRGASGAIVGAISASVDITKRKQAEARLAEANAKLEALASTDGLTGLANHRAFREALDGQVRAANRSGAPLSLLLLDVDSFKSFNDTYGHQAGDEVLATVGQILRGTARDTDFPARYGGEEFVVILPNTTEEQAAEAAERLRAAIEAHPWTVRSVTASFGAATLRADTDSTSLLSEADRAMYCSKQAGRNRVTHFTKIEQQAA